MLVEWNRKTSKISSFEIKRAVYGVEQELPKALASMKNTSSTNNSTQFVNNTDALEEHRPRPVKFTLDLHFVLIDIGGDRHKDTKK